MAYTNIDKPKDFFSATLYTGDGSADQSMTGAGFKPDFLWIKRRNASERHVLTNVQMGVSDGAYKWLDSADTHVEFSGGTGVASFDADGFSIKTSDTTWNASGSTYVFWSWKANGGTTASNSNGSITSTVQANQDAGFSIVTFTGTGSAATVGHGLGAAPAVIIAKNRDSSANWLVRHKNTTNNYDFLYLNSTSAAIPNDGVWTQTNPTTSVFSIGTATAINQSSQKIVAYCFAEKQGYSKFGKYVGTSNVNGPFIYLGFSPAFVMIKRTDQGTDYSSWAMFDNKRLGYNPTGGPQSLYANRDYGEGKRGQGSANSQEVRIDMLSNGFKVKDGGSDEINDSGDTYIYMAFAENPFVTSTGIPTTAR